MISFGYDQADFCRWEHVPICLIPIYLLYVFLPNYFPNTKKTMFLSRIHFIYQGPLWYYLQNTDPISIAQNKFSRHTSLILLGVYLVMICYHLYFCYLGCIWIPYFISACSQQYFLLDEFVLNNLLLMFSCKLIYRQFPYHISSHCHLFYLDMIWL